MRTIVSLLDQDLSAAAAVWYGIDRHPANCAFTMLLCEREKSPRFGQMSYSPCSRGTECSLEYASGHSASFPMVPNRCLVLLHQSSAWAGLASPATYLRSHRTARPLLRQQRRETVRSEADGYPRSIDCHRYVLVRRTTLCFLRGWNVKWMVPINQLDATQERAISEIVDNVHDDHLVSGFAGSGKTIVLTHVVERLAALPGRRTVCFATFTHALKDMVTSGLSASALNKTEITTFDALTRDRMSYDILVADELQDLKATRIGTVVGRYQSIVAAADFNQRIYRFAAKRHEIEGLIDGASSHQLGEIHRINENIFQIATTIYPDAAPRRAPQVRDDDEKARFFEAPSKREEFRAIYAEASRVAAPEYPSAVFFPSAKIMKDFIDVLASANSWGTPPALKSNADESEGPYDAMNAFLDAKRTSLHIFGSGSGEMARSDSEAVVYLMTYHSSKGLDFPNVFLPHLTDDTSLEPMKGARDDEERRLFFVAVTRARQRLYLSYHGMPHRFLDEIPWDYVDKFTPPRRSYS